MATPANLPCPRLHELLATTLGALRRSAQSDVYAPGFQCDGCHCEFNDDGDAVAHCASCEYDLCGGCWEQLSAALQCPNGHPLHTVYAAEFLAATAAANNSFACSGCGTVGPNWPARNCSRCAVSLCPACVQMRLGYDVTFVVRRSPAVVADGVRPRPPRPHIRGKMVARPRPPPVHHMEGEVAAEPQDYDPEIGSEWRRLLREAGFCDAALQRPEARRFVLEAVGSLMVASPQARSQLAELPPVSSVGRSQRDIVAGLRGAFARYNRSADQEAHRGIPAPK